MNREQFERYVALAEGIFDTGHNLLMAIKTEDWDLDRCLDEFRTALDAFEHGGHFDAE